VVEDSPTNELIIDLLKGGGLKVMVATNGMEALEQVQLSCPDLVVLDVVMPKLMATGLPSA